MNTDRELLELAAKAVGYVIESHTSFGAWVYPSSCKPNEDGEWPIFLWSPQHDDGDALRLAVKLEMQLRILHKENEVSVYGSPDGRVDESVHGDPFAATRRAIVRVAAEIGRAMP